MNNPEFALFLSDNLYLYLLMLPVVLIFYLSILRKYCSSIIDPMFLCVVSSALAFVPVLYLYYFSFISLEIFVYCILAESLFWLGFMSTYKKSAKRKENEPDDEKNLYNLFVIFACFVIIVKMVSYSLYGIPLLRSNRFEIMPSGGFMMLIKIAAVFNFYCFIYSLYNIKKIPIFASTYIVFTIVTGFLGGGRSFALGIVSMYFVYKTFIKKEKIRISFTFLVAGAIVISTPILVILVNSEDFEQSVTKYLFRIVAYGDIYWNAFPYNQVEKISITSPFLHFFSQILGPLRLIDYNQHGEPIGRLLYWEINDISYYGENGGANARPVVLGYVLFKYWGVVFCYICGCIMSFLMSGIRSCFRENFLSEIIVGYIYISSVSFATDPVMAWGFVIPLVLVVVMVKYLNNILGYRSFRLIRNRMSCDIKKLIVNKSLNRKILFVVILTCIIALYESL